MAVTSIRRVELHYTRGAHVVSEVQATGLRRWRLVLSGCNSLHLWRQLQHHLQRLITIFPTKSSLRIEQLCDTTAGFTPLGLLPPDRYDETKSMHHFSRSMQGESIHISLRKTHPLHLMIHVQPACRRTSTRTTASQHGVRGFNFIDNYTYYYSFIPCTFNHIMSGQFPGIEKSPPISTQTQTGHLIEIQVVAMNFVGTGKQHILKEWCIRNPSVWIVPPSPQAP